MGYQSKTYSLSDEVVGVFDRFKRKGLTPNQLLTRAFRLGHVQDTEQEWREFFDAEMDRHRKERGVRVKEGKRR